MRYYLDTEFAEDGKRLVLISIGIVAEDGRELYAVSKEFDPAACNPWVKEHVLPQLPPSDASRSFQNPDGTMSVMMTWCTLEEISGLVKMFVGEDPAPEFWGYFADYDWVLFCRLFGAMADLPPKYPFLCLDLKQYAYHLGIARPLKEHVPQFSGEHDALCDARWNSLAHRWLMEEQARRWVRRG